LGEIRKGCALLDPGKRRTTLEQWLENDIRNWFANRILLIDDAIAECWGRVVTHNVEDFDSLDVSIVNPWA
jgi:predicted nucleic acid-binding protein